MVWPIFAKFGKMTHFSHLLGCCLIKLYTLLADRAPWRNFATCKVHFAVHFASESCVVYWQRYCTASSSGVSQALRRGTRNGITELSQRRHLHSAGRSSHWASVHFLVCLFIKFIYLLIYLCIYLFIYLFTNLKKKPWDENIMSASATQGGHNDDKRHSPNHQVHCRCCFWVIDKIHQLFRDVLQCIISATCSCIRLATSGVFTNCTVGVAHFHPVDPPPVSFVPFNFFPSHSRKHYSVENGVRRVLSWKVFLYWQIVIVEL